MHYNNMEEKRMKYYISIDAGGNKSVGVLFDQTGAVIACEEGRGANSFDIGPAETSARLCAAVDSLKTHLPEGARLSAVFGSISAAYYYPEVEVQVKRHADGAKCKLDGVVSSVMAAVLGRDDGVCLISGVGSYCCVRQKGEHRFFIGSTGYMLDTEGSGYVLGREALNAAQRERDGRGPKTKLTEMIEKEIGETVQEHLPVIYTGGRAYIASFAHNVFSARSMGDPVATGIFNRAVDHFSEALNAAYKHIGHPFKVAIGGGVFLHFPEYVEAVRAKAPAGCELIVLDTPAVYGSALEAVWLTGEAPEAGFRSRFIETFNRHPSKRAAW